MKNKLDNNKQKSFYFQNFINEDNKNNINSSYSLFNSRANFVFKIFGSFLYLTIFFVHLYKFKYKNLYTILIFSFLIYPLTFGKSCSAMFVIIGCSGRICFNRNL